jgi:hypothetical protein
MRRSLALAALSVWVRTASAYDVTVCGQTVPAGTVGQLQADLACSPSTDDGGIVILAPGATLAMNGHTISQPPGPFYGIGVLCLSKCTVTGPGEITGNLIAVLGPNVIASDLDIHDAEAGLLIVRSFAEQTRLGKVTATNVSILRTEFVGLYAKKASLTGVTSSENALTGIQAARLTGTNLTTNDNERGGIVAASATVDGLIAANNALAGGSGGFRVTRHGRLANAALSGNRFDQGFGGGLVDADVISPRTMVVLNVTCGHSLRLSSSGEDLGTLGICGGD